MEQFANPLPSNTCAIKHQVPAPKSRNETSLHPRCRWCNLASTTAADNALRDLPAAAGCSRSLKKDDALAGHHYNSGAIPAGLPGAVGCHMAAELN